MLAVEGRLLVLLAFLGEFLTGIEIRVRELMLMML